MSKVRIGIIGSRFQADCVAGAAKAVPDEVEVVAVASPTKGHAADFAKRHGVARASTDDRELLGDGDVELVWVTAPNRLRAQMTIDAAEAGKHVVWGQPLRMALDEADGLMPALSPRRGL